jgi:hypothetical protein
MCEVHKPEKLIRKDTPQTSDIFCKWHMATKENPAGTDCSAHMIENRVFPCPYPNPEAQLKAAFPCSDYEPLGEESTQPSNESGDKPEPPDIGCGRNRF